MNKRIKNNLIKQLKDKKVDCIKYHDDIPEEYREDKEIIDAERHAGIRKIGQRGFDVINQVFFVNEDVLCYNDRLKHEYLRDNVRLFETFEDYYDYLNGDIYENACYYQYDFAKIKKKLDEERLHERNSFIDYNIDSFNLAPSNEEILQYQEGEKTKKQVKKWAAKFINCDSFEKLKKTVVSYDKSAFHKEHRIGVEFFFWLYIFYDLKDKKRFQTIMQYMSTGYYPEYLLIQPLCHVYDPDEVLAAFNYSLGSQTTINRHKKELRQYVESIKENNQIREEKTKVYFNEWTHYYCERSDKDVCRYFETFDDLIRYRDYDLRNADLSKDIALKYDYSKCLTDNTTKLPISNSEKYSYTVQKEWADGRFRVLQTWSDDNGTQIKHYLHTFKYFFDFVAFLKGDLSNADLLLCDGLRNLTDGTDILFNDAKITSAVCNNLGLDYKPYNLNTSIIESFALTKKNEQETSLTLQSSREMTTNDSLKIDSLRSPSSRQKIYYITDLHLMHKLANFEPQAETDVEYVIHNIVNTIVEETENILLIGGDVSSDYEIFKMFIRFLRNELNKRKRNTCVIFVLGNHELWEFPEQSFEKIVNKYEKLITEYGMHILQNDILYLNSDEEINRITNKELSTITVKDLRGKIINARLVFFGGLAFSGKNTRFNAYNGIYRDTISRDEEIKESNIFKGLYDKVLDAVPDKKVVVLTHTPMDCWADQSNYHKNYVYVSGHTHQNLFYDDGEIRIYADNQIGYGNNTPHLKWFDLDNEYDIFTDYENGIYQISAKEYQQFYRGKNLPMTFTRDINKLYMLKKNGFYCFIHESKGGSLTILNGGALKRLEVNDINYYYSNMDSVIATIKAPLDKYTSVQEIIAGEIRKLGGSGNIHGCIVDIDWFNHVYVNPTDLKITAYWASDIINKRVFPSVPALLEMECPELFSNYKRMLNNSSKELPVLAKATDNRLAETPVIYLDTDIYQASREIRKMQKLHSNILTTWYEADNNLAMIEVKE